MLHHVTEHVAPRSRIAVVGETGSGKSTFAKLLTRLMDPMSGVVRLDGVDVRHVGFDSLRARVVMVPQEGFLFDDTVLANLRFGAEISRADVELALTELGLDQWVAGLPAGLDTPVGQRGESLSAGSGNWSPWPAPISPIPISSSSTKPPPPSTPPPRSASSAPWTPSLAAAPPSRSRTGSPPPRRLTR